VVIVRFSDACSSLFVRPCRRGFRNSVSGTRRVTVDDAVSELIEPRRQPSRGLGHVRLLGDGVVEIGQQAASDLLA